MRLKLRVSRERLADITEELTALGIEIDPDAELVLTEENCRGGDLICRDDTDTVFVPLEDIFYIEAQGHDVFVHTRENRYRTRLRVYHLESLLPADRFIRISNAVIIERSAIQRVKPGLSCRFFLTLKNGAQVDVSRTYYYRFKEFFGI